MSRPSRPLLLGNQPQTPQTRFVHWLFRHDGRDYHPTDDGYDDERIAFAPVLIARYRALGYDDPRIEVLLYDWIRFNYPCVFPTNPVKRRSPFSERIGSTMVLDLTPEMLTADGEVDGEVLMRMCILLRPKTVKIRHGATIIDEYHLEWAPPAQPESILRQKVSTIV